MTYGKQIAASALEFATSSFTFWKQTGAVYEAENPRDPDSKTGRTREALKSKVTWLFCFFVFGYVGAEGKSPFLILLPIPRRSHGTNNQQSRSAAGS